MRLVSSGGTFCAGYGAGGLRFALGIVVPFVEIRPRHKIAMDPSQWLANTQQNN